MLKDINLESANIRTLKFNNSLGNGGNVNLEVRLNVEKKVNPEDLKKVMGSIECKIFSVDEKRKKSGLLELDLVVDGVYLLVNDFDECNDELEQSIVITLFPYLQNYIKIITSLSDMPPISLPYPIGSK